MDATLTAPTTAALTPVAARSFASGDEVVAALDLARDLLGLDTALVCQVEGSTWTAVHARGDRFGLRPGDRVPLEAPLFRRIVGSVEPLLVADAPNDPRSHTVPAVRALGIGTFVGVPLCLGDGSVWGALCAIDPAPAAAGPEAIQTLQMLARFVATDLDRRRAEERLRESEERFRGAFEYAAIGMALVGLDGRFLRVNRSLCGIVGYPSDELLAKTFQEITHPADLDSDLAHVERLLAGEVEAYEMEKRYLRADGGIAWVLLSVSLVRDAVGCPLHFIAQVQDISARKAAEADLAAERDLLQTLIDRLPDPVYVKDVASRFVRVNRAAAALYSLADPASAVGKTDFDVFPGELARQFFAAEQELLASGAPTVDELEHHAGPDDRRRWFLSTKVPLRDASGHAVGLVGISRDVTELKRIQDELRVAEERYRLLVERLPAVVYLLANDEHQTPLYLSPRVEELLGYRPDEVPARSEHWCDLVHPDDRDWVAAEGARTDATGEAFRCEYRYRRRDGRYVWVRDECEAVRDAEGKVVAWHGVLFDVSEQRRLRDELVAAKEAAEAASRLKSAFLSTMSHELRTPLTAIMGYTGVLLEGLNGPLAPEQEVDVACIARGAERLLGLVNDVLDLSKIEAGALELRREPVALERVLEQVAAEVAPLAAAKRLVLAVEPAPGVVVEADAPRLHQILLNLVGNAIKFTEAGSVRVAVQDTGRCVRIAVADTGIGVAPEVLPHVFEEFRQADDSTTRRYGGTGLGLAITKRLVEAHGGTITATSEPGIGTTFAVTLPARQPAPSAPIASAERTVDPAGWPMPGHPGWTQPAWESSLPATAT